MCGHGCAGAQLGEGELGGAWQAGQDWTPKDVNEGTVAVLQLRAVTRAGGNERHGRRAITGGRHGEGQELDYSMGW